MNDLSDSLIRKIKMIMAKLDIQQLKLNLKLHPELVWTDGSIKYIQKRIQDVTEKLNLLDTTKDVE